MEIRYGLRLFALHHGDDAEDGLEQSALAAAVGADDADDLAARDIGGDAAQHNFAVVGDGDIAEDKAICLSAITAGRLMAIIHS